MGRQDALPYLAGVSSRLVSQLHESGSDVSGVWVYGLDGKSTTGIHGVDLTGNVALVLGGEAEGMRRLTREHCDALVKIPMPGEMESLNVSVAAGVALFEVVRQRLGAVK